MKSVQLVYGDDWKGLYVNGKLAYEGHSITPKEILDAIGIESEWVAVDPDWLESRGSLPENLSEVVLEKEDGE